MEEIKAPNNIPKKIFLAGSIEMGKAINWQEQITQALKDENVIILNPRRDDWDSSWKQEIGNKQFREQVEWELLAQEKADIIAMYIDPETKSPITLLELGLFAHAGKITVCCPEGFYRKGNVDIVCDRYGIKQVNTLKELIKSITPRDELNKKQKEIYLDEAGLEETMEKITAQSVVNALIERFDGIEDETGKDFSDSRRIILRWAKDKKIFKDNPYE